MSEPVLRRDTNISLPEPLLRRARDLGIDLSQACERGLAAEIDARARDQWLDDNRDAFSAWNDYVGEHGLPLDRYRPR